MTIETVVHVTTIYTETDERLMEIIHTYQSGYRLEIQPDPNGRWKVGVWRRA